MTPTILIWLSLTSLVVMVVSALAATILPDMRWHDLEEYCERKGKRSLFGVIHERHEQAALASQCLHVLSLSLFLIASQAWLLKSSESVYLQPLTFVTDVAAITLTLLILTVWLPWAVAEHFGPAFIYYTWPLWSAVSVMLYPVTAGADVLGELLGRAAGIEDEPFDEEEEFEEEIRAIVTEGIREGHMEEGAREMIEGVMELDDSDVAEIMTPRSEIDSLADTTPWEDVVAFISRTGRTRIPIWQGNRDNITGIMYVKDLLPELTKPLEERTPLIELTRQPVHVPISMAVSELLKYFLRRRIHLVLVVDEYNAVSGLVTIEDVLEEIVGEIVDEHDLDDVDTGIVQTGEGEADVSGKTHIEDINELLGWELPDEDDYDTIAGLIIHQLKRIPKSGERLQIGEILVEVILADRRRIHQVRLVDNQRAQNVETR